MERVNPTLLGVHRCGGVSAPGADPGGLGERIRGQRREDTQAPSGFRRRRSEIPPPTVIVRRAFPPLNSWGASLTQCSCLRMTWKGVPRPRTVIHDRGSFRWVAVERQPWRRQCARLPPGGACGHSLPWARDQCFSGDPRITLRFRERAAHRSGRTATQGLSLAEEACPAIFENVSPVVGTDRGPTWITGSSFEGSASLGGRERSDVNTRRLERAFG